MCKGVGEGLFLCISVAIEELFERFETAAAFDELGDVDLTADEVADGAARVHEWSCHYLDGSEFVLDGTCRVTDKIEKRTAIATTMGYVSLALADMALWPY
jgi:hypothetical protein